MHDYQICDIVVSVVSDIAQLRAVKKLYSPDRTPSICKIRDTVLYVVRQKTQLSSNEIGRIFQRDHASILAAVKREAERLRRKIPWHGGKTWVEYHEMIMVRVDAIITETVSLQLFN